MAELGYFCLIVALVLALYGGIAAVLGNRRGDERLWASARNCTLLVFGLVTIAALTMILAFIRRDFSIQYVALNTSRDTPLIYRISGLWGSLEGSLLLWTWLQALFTALVVVIYRRSLREIIPYATAVLLAICAFFLLVMVIPANPFKRVFPVPPDGRGLNPLLQDPGMAGHPPMLYLGFVGFSVPYAFAMAALVSGRLGEEWIRATTKWTLAAWYFLTIGVIMGGWWAYHMLGWGGIWAWDPVENASLLPWLSGTAFLHSVMVQERRRMLKAWNLSLIITTFVLTLFGTFLTRSGILASVHAFSQSTIGSFFLSFIAITLFCSLGWLLWRGDRLKGEAELDSMVSRESAFLLNNLILLGILFTVLLGTLFPLISEAVRGVKVSVGGPFFNQVSLPLGLALLVLMGIGPVIAWRKASLDQLRRNFAKPLAAALIGGLLLFALGLRSPWVLTTLILSIFVAGTIVLEFLQGARARMRIQQERLLRALTTVSWRHRRRYGGLIIHMGVVLIIIGLAASFGLKQERESVLQPGDSLQVGRYTLTYRGLSAYPQANQFIIAANLSIFNQGKKLPAMSPAKSYDRRRMQEQMQQEQAMQAGSGQMEEATADPRLTPTTRAAIRSTLLEDLYLVLGAFQGQGELVTIRALVNPLVSWIWFGAVVITLGTLMALWPERRAQPVKTGQQRPTFSPPSKSGRHGGPILTATAARGRRES